MTTIIPPKRMDQRQPGFGNTATLELYSCRSTLRIPKTGNRDLTSDSCFMRTEFCPGRVTFAFPSEAPALCHFISIHNFFFFCLLNIRARDGHMHVFTT